MKTNNNKAHQLLNENSTVYDTQLTGFENMCKLYSIAKEAVDIASIPNWYYPSKQQFPGRGDNCSLWCNIDRVGHTDYKILYYVANNSWVDENDVLFTDEHIIAWTNLPSL